MADTYTTNLNLTKPEPGAAEDTWGISLNADLDSLDAIFGSGGTAVSMGAVTLDSLTVDGVASIDAGGNNTHTIGRLIIDYAGSGNPKLMSEGGDQISIDADLNIVGGEVIKATSQPSHFNFKQARTGYDIAFYTSPTANNTFVKALDIASNGDISFYDDTGSSENLKWDASADTLNFVDNAKATFGASNDLQIYHDGSNSYIKNSGTGNLYIQDTDYSGDVYIQAQPNENSIIAYNNSSVVLFYDNAQKLTTQSTGIDVTGTVTSDGLTVDGTTTLSGATLSGDLLVQKAAATITVKDSNDGGTVAYVFSNNSGNTSSIRGASSSQDIQIKPNEVLSALFESGGDISFYDDTGTSQNLKWDASADTLNFVDNAKATFGAGNDLQIYHNGSNSYIKDGGTGELLVQSNLVAIQNAAGSENMAKFIQDGAVQLYYDDSKKLATTSSGINVTGTVTSDGLTVGSGNITASGNEGVVKIATVNSGSGTLWTDINTGDNAYSSMPSEVAIINSADNTANSFAGVFFQAGEDSSGLAISSARIGAIRTGSATTDLSFATRGVGGMRDRLRVFSGGDISFYDDTGTTQGLFWDASAEALGLGTSSPTYKLHVRSADASDDVAYIHHDNASQSSGTLLKVRTDAGDSNGYTLLDVQTNSGSALFVRGDRNVGIGTASPGRVLHVEGTASVFGDTRSVLRLADNTAMATGVGGGLVFAGKATTGQGDSNTTFAAIHGLKENGTSTNTAGAMLFSTRTSGSNPEERMRITSSGELLLNKTSASVGTDGVQLRPSSYSGFSATSTTALFVNRNTTDGDVVEIGKNGVKVGSIGTTGGEITIGTNNTGIRFTDAADRIDPWNPASNLARDNAIDLGTSSRRFKDLYLSGRVIANGVTTSAHAWSSQSDSTSSSVHLYFRNPNGFVGNIATSGTATSYNTSSDARLKDVTGEARGLEVITKLNPVAYNWKADGKADEGLIAQEVKELVPNAVTGSENEHYQMDYSKLVTHLVKAVQELEQQTIELKKEIANLKGE